MPSLLRKCDVCRCWIPPEHLEVAPESELCFAHAVEAEAYGGEHRLTWRQERTSKSGSLKLNYGSVIPKSVRNPRAVERVRLEYEQSHF